ncbi:MAG: hypothetical protein FJW30_02650 [Acidobacteria bacterium]|nr:hypothetical protein [Acidobacteriota bacterium]
MFRIFLICWFTGVAMFAQTDSWERLRAVPVGIATHVHTRDGRTLKGELAGVEGNVVVLRKNLADRLVDRADIVKVSVRKPSKRWRNGWIGAGIATAIVLTAVFQSSGDLESIRFLIGGTALYAGAGFGIGALIPGYETVYKARRK